MKFTWPISIALVLILISTVMPTSHADPSIVVYSYTLSPEILMPGDSATLTLTIKNAETTATTTHATSSTSSSYTDTITTVETNGATINNIWISYASDSNDKRVKAKLNYRDLGYLAAGSSFSICFEILADENISEGLYFPRVNIDVEETAYEDVSFPIPVKVSNDSVDLIATSVPSKLSVSGSTELTLTAVNKLGTSVEGVTVTPGNAEGVEFMPKSYFVGALAAGASKEVTFYLIPKTVGVKNLSFVTSFKNGDNSHNTALAFSAEIIDTFDVAPIFTTIPSSIKKGSSARVSIEIYNAKTDTITGVIVTPICNATIIPSQYFIGSMDPDDVFSASFDLYTDALDYGTYSIGFKVSFKQGNEYYETPVVSNFFSVTSTDGTSYQSSSTSSQQSSSGATTPPSLTVCIGTILVIVIIIVAAAILFLKLKKRRNDR